MLISGLIFVVWVIYSIFALWFLERFGHSVFSCKKFSMIILCVAIGDLDNICFSVLDIRKLDGLMGHCLAAQDRAKQGFPSGSPCCP